MKHFKYLLPILIATLIVGGIVWAANFPTSLNNFQYGDYILSEDWNALESTIGITNSAVITSHDYLIAQRLTIVFASTTYWTTSSATYWETQQTARGFSTTSNDYWGSQRAGTHLSWASDFDIDDDFPLYAFASSTYWTTSSASYYLNASSTLEIDIVGNLTGTASLATALASNPSDCAANQFANTIAASGNLTCAAIVDADVPDSITASNYLLRSNWFTTTTQETITSLPNFPFYPAFTYSTTTWVGTTTVALGVAYVGEIWTGASCFTNVGNVALRFGDGTNKMNYVLATSTPDYRTLSTNNTFTALEKRYVELGSPETAPTMVSCTIKKNY